MPESPEDAVSYSASGKPSPDGAPFRWFVTNVAVQIILTAVFLRFGSTWYLLIAPALFVAVALATLPRKAHLRPEHFGRQRWVRALAVLLAAAYVLVVLLGSRSGTNASFVGQILLLWGSAALVVWRSVRPGMSLYEAGSGLALLLMAATILTSGPRLLLAGEPLFGIALTVAGSAMLAESVCDLTFGRFEHPTRVRIATKAMFATAASLAAVEFSMRGMALAATLAIGTAVVLILFAMSGAGKSHRWLRSVLFFVLSAIALIVAAQLENRVHSLCLVLLAVTSVFIRAAMVRSEVRWGTAAVSTFALAGAIAAAQQASEGSRILAFVFAVVTVAGMILGVGVIRRNARLVHFAGILLLITFLASAAAIATAPKFGGSPALLIYVLLSAISYFMLFGEGLWSRSLRQRFSLWLGWWTEDGTKDAHEGSRRT